MNLVSFLSLLCIALMVSVCPATSSPRLRYFNGLQQRKLQENGLQTNADHNDADALQRQDDVAHAAMEVDVESSQESSSSVVPTAGSPSENAELIDAEARSPEVLGLIDLLFLKLLIALQSQAMAAASANRLVPIGATTTTPTTATLVPPATISTPSLSGLDLLLLRAILALKGVATSTAPIQLIPTLVTTQPTVPQSTTPSSLEASLPQLSAMLESLMEYSSNEPRLPTPAASINDLYLLRGLSH